MAADSKTAPASRAGADESTQAAVAAAVAKHATLRYTTLRIIVFLVSLAVMWGVVAATGHIVTGSGFLYLMMGALILSGIASFFLLNKQRDAMSAVVTARADRLTNKIAKNSAMEDED